VKQRANAAPERKKARAPPTSLGTCNHGWL
jgi:hypothetical protein